MRSSGSRRMSASTQSFRLVEDNITKMEVERGVKG